MNVSLYRIFKDLGLIYQLLEQQNHKTNGGYYLAGAPDPCLGTKVKKHDAPGPVQLADLCQRCRLSNPPDSLIEALD